MRNRKCERFQDCDDDFSSTRSQNLLRQMQKIRSRIGFSFHHPFPEMTRTGRERESGSPLYSVRVQCGDIEMKRSVHFDCRLYANPFEFAWEIRRVCPMQRYPLFISIILIFRALVAQLYAVTFSFYPWSTELMIRTIRGYRMYTSTCRCRRIRIRRKELK